MESTLQPANNKKASKIALIGLDPTFSRKELVNFFKKKFNSTKKCVFLPMSKKKKKSKGKGKGNLSSVATLILENQQEAEKILQIARFEYRGRSFLAKPFMDRKKLKKFQKLVKQRRVFIHNIHNRVTSKRLYKAFQDVCDIEEAYVIKKASGGGQGFTNYGYVTFRNIEEAKKMIKIGTIIIDGWRVNIAPFREKNGAAGSQASKTRKSEVRRSEPNHGLQERQRRADGRDVPPGCQKNVISSARDFGSYYPENNLKIYDLDQPHQEYLPIAYQDHRTKDKEEQGAEQGPTNLREFSHANLKQIGNSYLENYYRSKPCRFPLGYTSSIENLSRSLQEELKEFGALRLNHSGKNLRLNKDDSRSNRRGRNGRKMRTAQSY